MVMSAFLSAQVTRPHVMVMLVGEVEETWRSAGGEEATACREMNMTHCMPPLEEVWPTSYGGGSGGLSWSTVPCCIPGCDGDGEVTVLL